MQPQILVLLSLISGTSMVNESVWDNRFRYVEQLRKLGANIDVEGAYCQLWKAWTSCREPKCRLRTYGQGAAMVLAGLAAEGSTTITNVQYIDRGYEGMVEKLTSLGACIDRITDDGAYAVYTAAGGDKYV